MKILLFAKADGIPERRIAEFTSKLTNVQIGVYKSANGDAGAPVYAPKAISHVHVQQLIGMEHEPCSPSFDCVRLNLKHLIEAGVTELRLEVQE